MSIADTEKDPDPTIGWEILSLGSAKPSWPGALLLLACSALPKYVLRLFLTSPSEPVAPR